MPTEWDGKVSDYIISQVLKKSRKNNFQFRNLEMEQYKEFKEWFGHSGFVAAGQLEGSGIVVGQSKFNLEPLRVLFFELFKFLLI